MRWSPPRRPTIRPSREPLKRYFPRESGKFEAQMAAHRLRREIIATQLADDLVNRCGPSFIDRSTKSRAPTR